MSVSSMKAVIPAAGQGTRLYPHTHTKPKAMVRIAGKPILGHILSRFLSAQIDEVVIVVGGPMQDQIVEYALEEYGDCFKFSFVEQEVPKGLGHSIYQAEQAVNEDDIIISLGDMLFKNNYESFIKANARHDGIDASIGTKPVEEPQHYGVVELENGRITNLIEKPEDPPSNLAVSGVYIIENTPLLFDALDYLIRNKIRGTGGEYQLTDALDRMIDYGAMLTTFEIDDWYDCGRPETLLEANRVTLNEMDTNTDTHGNNTVVIEPVDFGDGVRAEESVIGPYVSVDDRTTITNSIVRDSIIGQDSMLCDTNLEESLIGDQSTVVGEANNLNIGDNSSITF